MSKSIRAEPTRAERAHKARRWLPSVIPEARLIRVGGRAVPTCRAVGPFSHGGERALETPGTSETDRRSPSNAGDRSARCYPDRGGPIIVQGA
jgi:hypothetical protein